MSVNNEGIDVPSKRVGRTVAFAVVETSLSTSDKEAAAACTKDEKKPLLVNGGEKPPSASPRYGARRRSSTALLAVERALRTRQRLWSTTVSAFIASIPALLVGYTIGFPSSALLDLTGDVGDLPEDYQFTTLLSDLFAAIAPVGAMFGGPIAGSIADHWGRKMSLVLSGVPYFIGYLMLSYAHYLSTAVSFKSVILVGRFFTGVGMGWACSASPVYIGEISAAKFRGVFGSFTQIGLATGIVLNYSIGTIPGFPYFYNSLVAAGIVAIFEVLMVWLKETPRWLVSKSHYQEAYHTLIWLRGPNVNIEDEIRSIESSDSSSIWRAWKEFSKRNVAVPVMIVIVVMFFQQVGGLNAISSFAASLFEEAGVANPRATATYAVGGVELFSTFISILVIDLIGRKILLIISGIGMTVGTALLGVHFYITRPSLCVSGHNSTLTDLVEMLQDSTTDAPCNTQYGPLAIVSIITFGLAFSLGFGPVAWILLSELIPLQVRGLASGIAILVNWGTSAIVVGFYLEYADIVHVWFAWWSFAILNAAGVLFVIVFIRETKGKTLEDIEKYYLEHRF